MRYFLIQFLFFSFLFTSFAQPEKYIIQSSEIQINNGLTSNLIGTPIEDKRGFIWIPTKDGAARFDGINYDFFPPIQATGEASPCSYLFEDIDGNIWGYYLKPGSDVGIMQGGFKYIIDSTYQVHDFDEWLNGRLPFPASQIGLAQAMPGGIIYFITRHSGEVYRYNGRFQIVAKFPSIQEPYFLNIRPDHTLVIRGNEDSGFILSPPSHPGDTLFTVQRLPDGSERHLFLKDHLSNATLTWEPPFSELTDFFPGIESWANFKPGDRFTVQKVIYSDGRQFYTVNRKHQLFLLDENRQLICDFSDEILKVLGPVSRVKVLLVRKNQLIIQRVGRIIVLDFHPNYFETYFNENSDFAARAVIEMPDKTLVAAGSNRVYSYFKPTGKTRQDRILKLNLWGATQISDEEVLLGSYNFTPLVFRPKTGDYRILNAPVRTYKGKRSNQLFTPLKDSGGNIFIGTIHGLIQWSEEKQAFLPFDKYNDFPELAHVGVQYLTEMEDGCWASCFGGLYRFNAEEGVLNFWKFPFNGSAYQFYRNNDVFWLATYGQGLVKWNIKTGDFKKYDRQFGFLNNYLTGIFPDQSGNLWIASETGLIRFDTTAETFRIFLDSDGLSQNEFNRGTNFQAPDGKIYFCSLNGVTGFYPRRVLSSKPQSAPFRLTQYAELNPQTGIFEDKTSEIIARKQIYLPPGRSSFIIRFALLNFKQALKTKYAYKIKGLENQWNNLDQNFIRLNNLPFGEYSLVIRAKDYTGQWNPTQIELPLIVAAPFYAQTRWQISGFLLFLGLLYIGFRWRFYLVQKEKERLEEIIRQRTSTIEDQKNNLSVLNANLKSANQTKDRLFAILGHDLRNPVLSFQSLARSMSYLLEKKDYDRLSSLGEFIEKEANHLHLLLENLLNWALTQRDELPTIINSISVAQTIEPAIEQVRHIARFSKIQLEVELPEDLRVLADSRILETVFRNLVSNALRELHAGGKIAVTGKQLPDNRVQIKVSDNGPGIPEARLKTIFEIHPKKNPSGTPKISIGLHLSHELIQLLGGTLSVQSQPGKGTSFFITLPSPVK